MSYDQIPAQTTKSEATVIGAPDQKLRSIIETQNPQNIQNSQSTISNSFNTTLKGPEKNTPKITKNTSKRRTGIERS